MQRRIDTEALELANPIEKVVAQHCGSPRRQGQELVFNCPFGDHKRPKLMVNPKKRVWCCFSCDRKGSGAIDFVKAVKNCDFVEACQALGADLVQKIDPAVRARAKAQARKRAEREARQVRNKASWCLEVLARAETAELFCPVGDYLAGRGLDVDALAEPLRALKFHKRGPFAMGLNAETLPAMVAMIRRPAKGQDLSQPQTWSISGCHLTYLFEDPDGQWCKAQVQPAKKMFGGIKGGAIRLGPAASHLYLCEGIETGLALYQILNAQLAADAPAPSVWAVGSIAGFNSVVVPTFCEQVTLCADNDNRNPEQAKTIIKRAADAHVQQGRNVRVAYPDAGCDWLDMLTKEASL